MLKRSAIRQKLGDPATLLDPIFQKPKWMRWKTWQRYTARDEQLGAIEDAYMLRRWGRFLD
jgi:hypothetical protein